MPGKRPARLTPWLGLTPFLAFLLIFLVVPTVTVIVGAFGENGSFSLVNIGDLFTSNELTLLWKSVRAVGRQRGDRGGLRRLPGLPGRHPPGDERCSGASSRP